MSKIRVGNKINASLNGEYGGHVGRSGKKYTSGKRRTKSAELIREELEHAFTYYLPGYIPGFFDDDSLRYEGGGSEWLGDRCCESEGWENPKTYQGHPAAKTQHIGNKRKKITQKVSRAHARLKRHIYSTLPTKPHKLSNMGYSFYKTLWLKAA